MEILKEMIQKKGIIREGNILKVDSFLNHQMDIKLFNEIGKEFRRRFEGKKITKILTIEASGIGIACVTAQYFDVPVVFAKKSQTKNISGDVYKTQVTSFTHGRVYQARYLSGIVAGMKTKTNKIGYVAAMGKDNSEVTGGINAFAMGVYSVNPNAKVLVKVTNSWYDPAEETNASKALINEGCDVLAQHCDTPNPQLEAEKAGVWGVGYNSDMIKDAPKATLTSTIWNWGVYYTAAAKAAMDGTWKPENYFGGMDDGLVDITALNPELCTEEMEAKVQEARELIASGFNVFDGVIETNDGKTVGEEGKTLDDATITGGINWYFKNVVEK